MSGMGEKINEDGGRASPTSKDSQPFDIRTIQPNLRDLENGSAVSIEEAFDEDLVTWDGDDDPRSPYNWPLRQKLGMAVILSLGSLVSIMSASMMAPALPEIGRDLGIGPSSTQLTMSIYLLALACGPLIIAPFSEMYGRKPVWILCNVWYILFNTLCPVNRSRGLMVAGRFLSGLGASVSIALCSPCMADLWKAENRGKSFAITNFAGLFGAAIGPIVGGYVSQGVDWPWLFWTVSIFDAVLVLLGVFFVHESYAPVLLAKKSKRLRKNSERNYRTVFERSHPTVALKLQTSLYRPLHLLATRPIIHVCSLLIAYSFGVYVLALSTFANIWTDIYHESVSSSSLHYISIALGSTVASQVGGPVTDRIFLHLKSKAGGAVAPEYRVPLMIPGALLMPIGLFWYGWAAEKRVLWFLTDIGAGVFSCGVFLSMQAVLAYLFDEFAEHSASANAAARILSNVMGFAFPLFAPQLYQSLGYGWGNSLLAFLYLAIGVPAPLLLWKWGPKMRAMGKPTQQG